MMSSVLQQHISEFTGALIDNAQDVEYKITPGIKDASKISPQLALEIYRNNTRGTRSKALEQIYPTCRNILGNDTFRAIAMAYVIADTYGTADLNHYGETYSQYLRVILDAGRFPDEYAYLPDLAGLEYRFHTAYYADSDPEFDFELFVKKVTRGEQVYLQLSTTLGLLASRYPVYEIWLHNHPRAVNKIIEIKDRCYVQAISGTQYLLVHRKQYSPVITTINYREYRLLEAFNNNQSLQAVIDSVDYNIDVLLPRLISNKWIVGIKHHE